MSSLRPNDNVSKKIFIVILIRMNVQAGKIFFISNELIHGCKYQKIFTNLIDIKMQFIVANTEKYLHHMSLDKSEHIYMITNLDV